MRKDIYIDGVNYNAEPQRCLLKNGLDRLTFQMEDEDGKGTISSAKLRFTNIGNKFDAMLKGYSKPKVNISLGGFNVFSGVVSGDGINYDFDNKLIDTEVVSDEKTFIENAKITKLNDINLTGIPVEIYRISNPIAGQAETALRTMFPIDSLLSQIFHHFGYNFKIATPNSYEYMLGGTAVSKPFFPDINCYDMIVDLVKLYNAIWWIEKNGDVYFVPKVWYLEGMKQSVSLSVMMLKNTHKVTGVKVGKDIISFSYANIDYKHPNLWDTDLRATIKRYTPLVTEDAIVSLIKFPNLRSTLIRSISAVIYDDDPGCFVVKYDGNPPWGIVVEPAINILQKYYNMELLGTSEIEAEYSLMNDYSVIPELIKPYRKLSTSGDNTHFIRSVEIDATDDKAKINAIGYQL